MPSCSFSLSFQTVLDKTLTQFGIDGKRGIKKYWESLMKEHDRLQEEAEEQVEEFKRVMVGTASPPN